MTSGSRSSARPGAGPGRGKPRARASGRNQLAASQPRPPAVDVAVTEPTGVAGRRPSLTARAIALVVVLLILTISYASSLRIYFAQAHDIAAARVEIAERQQRMTTLQQDLARWGDPAYVRAQARERLGWVVPGETGFQVVGVDGKPLGGGAEIDAGSGPAKAPEDAWYADLWGSVAAADQPVPAGQQAQQAKPITTKTKPTR